MMHKQKKNCLGSINKEAINALTFTEEEGGDEDWVCFIES